MRGCDLKFVIVTTEHVKSSVITEGFKNQAKSVSLELSLPVYLFNVDRIMNNEGLGDAKRLARYYFGIDKYDLEELVDYENINYSKLFQNISGFLNRRKKAKLV